MLLQVEFLLLLQYDLLSIEGPFTSTPKSVEADEVDGEGRKVSAHHTHTNRWFL